MSYDDWKTQAPDDAADEFDRRQPHEHEREPESWEEWDWNDLDEDEIGGEE